MFVYNESGLSDYISYHNLISFDFNRNRMRLIQIKSSEDSDKVRDTHVLTWQPSFAQAVW